MRYNKILAYTRMRYIEGFSIPGCAITKYFRTPGRAISRDLILDTWMRYNKILAYTRIRYIEGFLIPGCAGGVTALGGDLRIGGGSTAVIIVADGD